MILFGMGFATGCGATQPFRIALPAADEPPYIGMSRLENWLMAEPAIRGMTVDEFLRWEDGSDTRYELVDGLVFAMAPAAPSHSRLAGRLGGAIAAALQSRPPCAMHPEAGIARPDRGDSCYI